MTKKIAAIWAEDRQGLIGVNGQLPWHLPAELAHFKSVTMGAAILMGRKTFDGMKRRLLPGRRTLVLSRSQAEQAGPVRFFQNKAAVLDWFSAQEKDLFIIGGAEIFRLFQDQFTELHRTVVAGEFVGDTYFPADFPFEKFEKISEKIVKSDKKNLYGFTTIIYERKSNV